MRNLILFLLIFAKTHSQNSKGDSLMNVKNYNQAILAYQKEKHFSKNYKIAKALEAKGNKNEALHYYKNYLKTDSINLNVNLDYGLLLLDLTQYNEAQKVLERISISNPSETIYYFLGIAYEKNNDFDKAIDNFQKASILDSLFFKSNYKLAFYYSLDKKYKDALKITNRFINQNDEDIEMLKLRSQIYFNQDDYKNAINDFNKLISLNQTDIFIYEKLAKSYYGNREYEKSIAIYNSLIEEISDENPEYFYNRGKCYGFLNKTKEAENDIKAAIALKTYTFENEYFYLGYFYQKQQNLDKALYYYKLTLKQDKNHQEANYQVISINDYKGENPEKTLKEYENFLLNFKNISEEKRFYIENRIKQLKHKLHMK